MCISVCVRGCVGVCAQVGTPSRIGAGMLRMSIQNKCAFSFQSPSRFTALSWLFRHNTLILKWINHINHINSVSIISIKFTGKKKTLCMLLPLYTYALKSSCMCTNLFLWLRYHIVFRSSFPCNASVCNSLPILLHNIERSGHCMPPIRHRAMIQRWFFAGIVTVMDYAIGFNPL